VSKLSAAAGSSLFLALAPGVVAGIIPWALTGWKMEPPPLGWEPLRWLGAALIAAGGAVLIHTFARFVIEGVGTPAPVAPTQRLVVGGLYRYVRNPMYLAVGATIVGQGLLLGQAGLLVYATVFFATVACFVYGYEQPALGRQFGVDYDAYRSRVPAWIPRPPQR
jgi:protein-S-isoprenylcysteine O-methyltransferase Ste14